MNNEPKMFQWHPAFFAGIQIELKDDADRLEFQNEVQLGTKPKEMDVLIINQDTNRPLKKNIARIFKKRNIIEYKGPTDYLSIDDFYTGYGYACFYKASATEMNTVKMEEITLTFVCPNYPRKLMQHLNIVRHYEVSEIDSGIFHISGDPIPIQIIVTSQLDSKENLWLKNLTNKPLSMMQAENLLQQYGKHKSEKLYQSVMNIIVRSNQKVFGEVKDMCDALLELMKDELEEREMKGELKGETKGHDSLLSSQITKKLSRGKSVHEIAEELEETDTSIKNFITIHHLI